MNGKVTMIHSKNSFLISTLLFIAIFILISIMKTSKFEERQQLLETVSLVALGVQHDGQSDVSAQLQRIFNENRDVCIDGENKTYLLRENIEVNHNFCLQNIKLIRKVDNLDLSSLMSSDKKIPKDLQNNTIDTEIFTFLDSDTETSEEMYREIKQYINIRVLLIRGSPQKHIKVHLSNVSIDRGQVAEAGSRTDSAAIWIDNANGIKLDELDISGKGKGHGIAIHYSKNIIIENTKVHNLYWSLYDEEPDLTSSILKKFYNNNLPIYEFNAIKRRFGYRRIQEQVNAIFITHSENVNVKNVVIEKVGTLVDNNFIPWQTDGVSLANVNNFEITDSDISQTWEAIDVGGHSNNIHIQNLDIIDSFAFGLKFPHYAYQADVKSINITRSGYSGVVLAGNVNHLNFEQIQIKETGYFLVDDAPHFPWSELNMTISGFRIMGEGEPINRPFKIYISNSQSLEKNKGLVQYGFYNDDPNFEDNGFVYGQNLDSENHIKERMKGIIELP